MFSRFVGSMASDHKRINELLAQAGMIMEDASVTALIADGKQSIEERIAAVRDAGRSVFDLAEAADKVRQRANL